MFRHKASWLLVVAAIVAGLAIPKWRASRSSAILAVAAASAPVDVLQVRVETVGPGPLSESLRSTGTILANERVVLVAEVPGRVEEILFEEGRLVEAGSVLVRLDDTVAVAELARAHHRLELGALREARQVTLLDQGLISQGDYDTALSELNVLSAEVALREAELDKMEIRASFRGIVGFRSISVGSYLSSQTQITSLQEVDPVKLEFSVPAQYAAEVSVGDLVGFAIKGRDERFTAEVYAIEPTVDRETRSLTVRARSPNPDGVLVPGAFADVQLVVREVPEALSVPSIAVVPELGGKKVWLFEDGVAKPRIVRTGIRTETRVEITSGLDIGDRVIVSAVQRLRTDLPVALEGPP